MLEMLFWAFKTSCANVKAAETAQDLVKLGLNVAPVPVKIYKQSNNHHFPYRSRQSHDGAKF